MPAKLCSTHAYFSAKDIVSLRPFSIAFICVLLIRARDAIFLSLALLRSFEPW